uniref:Membrane-associated protein n=1 Tax=Anopheles coluzzii TaxID=1518534 RepID=A0A8W7PHA7_ANOCL
MQNIKARVLLLLSFVVLLVGLADGLPVPNIIDAPRHKDDSIPSAIAGNPRPLLDGDAKTIIYDLAATITDEGFDAMESTNIGFLWNPLARFFSPLWLHQHLPVEIGPYLLQLLVDHVKAGPIVRLAAPALAHQIVHVILQVDLVRQPEVGDLHHHMVIDQTVAGGQIAVHKLALGQVHHAGRDLVRNVEQIAVRQLGADAVRPVLLRERGALAQELVQIAARHKLEQQTHRAADGADAEQLHDVGMVKFGQQAGFPLEIHLQLRTGPVVVDVRGQLVDVDALAVLCGGGWVVPGSARLSAIAPVPRHTVAKQHHQPSSSSPAWSHPKVSFVPPPCRSAAAEVETAPTGLGVVRDASSTVPTATQRPSTSSEVLIFCASFNRSPTVPVFLSRSEPARSQNLYTDWEMRCVAMECVMTVTVKMLCDRLELLFTSVAPYVALCSPYCSRAYASSFVPAYSVDSPLMNALPSFDSTFIALRLP